MKQPAKKIRATAERRKYNRYRLELPVIFSWKDARGILQKGVGLTRVMSIRGAFIFAARPPWLSAEIKLKVYLPERGAARPQRIYGHGQVVRVEPAHGRHRAGFAVAVEPFVVRRGPAYQCSEMTAIADSENWIREPNDKQSAGWMAINS
jgi:hypothetical protein